MNRGAQLDTAVKQRNPKQSGKRGREKQAPYEIHEIFSEIHPKNGDRKAAEEGSLPKHSRSQLTWRRSPFLSNFLLRNILHTAYFSLSAREERERGG